MAVKVHLWALPLLILACSGGNKAPTPAPTAKPVTPDPVVKPGGPEIVKLPLEADETPPSDCVAAPVDGGALDQTSDSFTRIEVKQHPQFVWEKATLKSGLVVVAQVGGCAHIGASYVVHLPADKPISDRAHYLGAALDVVMALPLRAGSRNHRAEIAEEIKPALGDAAKLSECDFPRGEIDRVMCGIAEEDDGKVHVSLAYDVAL